MPYLTKAQRDALGPVAQQHYADGDWRSSTVEFCNSIANEMLKGNQKALGLRAGRPKREVLMSNDFLDEAWMKLKRRSGRRRTA